MTIYTDDFNRTNGDLADSSNWENVYNAVEVDTNELNPDGASRSYARWVGGGTWGRTQEVEVEIGSLTGNTHVGPAVYLTSSGGYSFTVRPDNGSMLMQSLDGSGNISQLGISQGFGSAFPQGTVVKLRAEDDGSGDTLLTAYIDDVEQFTRTDSTFTSGNPGVHLEAFTNSSLDNWEANDFVSASETVTAIVTDASGNALANETGIDWAWTDSFSGNPTDTGSGESTDGSGELVVDVPNTTLSSGQFGYLRVRLSNDDVGIARESID